MKHGAEKVETVIIAGAAGHIGPAVASVLARAGYRLVVSGRRLSALERLCDALPEGGKHRPVAVDYSDVGAVEKLAEELRAGEEPPYALIHCVGPIRFNRSPVPSVSLWREMWEGNVLTAVNLLRVFLPLMMACGVGRVVLFGFSGIDARRGFSSIVPYAAAKEALGSLMRSAAKAAARRGVAVNMVSPGIVLRADRGVTRAESSVLRDIPAERFGTPGEIAQVVRWLLSPGASYITGQNIKVSGGLHISP